MTLNRRKEVLSDVVKHLSSQYQTPAAREELATLGPPEFDWNDRVAQAVDTLVPRLVEVSPALIEACAQAFNSPVDLAKHLSSDLPDRAIGEVAKLDRYLASGTRKWLEQCRELGELSARAIPNIESQQLSAQVERFLLSDDGVGDLVRANGKSIYPDLIRREADYSFLPFQSRSKPNHGPCLKNRKQPKPSNVPDGCEIKTNRSPKIKVDAHGAHPGLHLGITWEQRDVRVHILDVWIAYIRVCDYTISDGRVDVTTKKRSFGHRHFVSLTRGSNESLDL